MSSECPGVGIASTRGRRCAASPVTTGSPSSCSWTTWSCAVGAQDVGRGQLVLLGEGEQRLERCARVDEDGRATGLVADEVGVREVPGIQAPLDVARADRLMASTLLREEHMPGLFGRTIADHQVEVLAAARPGREPGRDARLLLRGAAAAAPERQARHRRRRDRQETARDPVHLDGAAGRRSSTVRRAGAAGDREDLAREALTRKAAIQGQLDGIMEQGQQLEAQQQKLIEGERRSRRRSSRSAPRRRSSRPSTRRPRPRCGSARRRRASAANGRRGARGRACEGQDRSRAGARRRVSELTGGRALETSPRPGDHIDRELTQIRREARSTTNSRS